jgi:hypothetical protein
MAKRVTFNQTPPEGGAQIPNLPGVSANDGSGQALETFAKGFYDFSSKLQTNVEAAAKDSGENQGIFDATQGQFKPREQSTIEAQAYNRLGMQTYVNQLHVTTSNQIDEIYAKNKEDPKALQDAFNGYAAGMETKIKETVPNAVVPFRYIFERNTKPLLHEAAKAYQLVQRSEALAVLNQSLDTSVTQGQRQAALAVNDLHAAADLALERDNFIQRLTENGPIQGFAFAGKEMPPDGTRPGALKPIEMEKRLKQFDDTVHEASAMGKFDQARQAGNGDEFLRTFIDEPPSELTPEQHTKLTTAMDAALTRDERNNKRLFAEQDAEKAKTQALAASNLEIGVHNGTRDETHIQQAFANDTITGPKRTELMLELQKVQKKKEEEAFNMYLVKSALMTGVPMDWKDEKQVKAVDEYYKTAIGPGLSPEVINQTAQLVKSTAIVPTQARMLIRSLARSGDPEHAVMAAELVSRINETSPQALETIPQDERAFSLMVTEAVNAGMGRVQAVDLAREAIYRTDPATKEKLKAVTNTPDFKKGNLKALNKGIDKNFDTLLRSQPDAPKAMQGEFENLTNLYYTKTQDPEQARTLAWQDLMHVWGVTDVNPGGKQMIKYSPEKIFGDGQPNNWMRKQLESDIEPYLTKRGVIAAFDEKGAAAPPPKADMSGVRIIADDITARAKVPSYAVMKQRTDGLFEPVLDDKNRPARWTPDFASTPQGQERAAEQKKMIKEAQRRRELTIEAQKGGYLEAGAL